MIFFDRITIGPHCRRIIYVNHYSLIRKKANYLISELIHKLHNYDLIGTMANAAKVGNIGPTISAHLTAVLNDELCEKTQDF